MTTNMKDYILEKIEELRNDFRETMEGQFEHGLYNKSFSNQLESDEKDTLQERIECGWWLLIEEVLYLTVFMIIAVPNCLNCIVKPEILKCNNW